MTTKSVSYEDVAFLCTIMSKLDDEEKITLWCIIIQLVEAQK